MMMVKMTFTSIDYQTFVLYREDLWSEETLDVVRFMTGDQIRQMFEADKPLFDIVKDMGKLQ